MKLPSFSLPASDGEMYTEKDFSDGTFIIYLYPKDMTSGCTIEAQDFRDLQGDFEKLGIKVFGLSKDSLKSHNKFCEKESLNFLLLSDEDCDLIKKIGSWVEKSMYGRKYFGIDRSTFVIKNGKILHEWRKVKARGHAEMVLEFCQKIMV